jgi:hypothetical protein
MKKAKSLYLSGELIEADQCDYSSSRELGLVCPFCSEAVFLRAGSFRDTTLRNGKKVTQIINANFAHYPGSFLGFDCELRANSKEGKEKLAQLIVESKNQRLKLFNQRFWELFKQDRNLREKKLIVVIKRYFPNLKEVEALSIKSRMQWRSTLSIIYGFLQETAEFFDTISSKEIQSNLRISIQTIEEEKTVNKMYFDSISKQYHYQICTEIVDFLATNTAGLAFYHLTKVAIATMILSTPDSKELENLIKDPHYICMAIAGQIYGTHWIKILKDELT